MGVFIFLKLNCAFMVSILNKCSAKILYKNLFFADFKTCARKRIIMHDYDLY